MVQIELIDVTKDYQIGGEDIKAVDNVSLKIERGEFISIVGHSGSGKTTLLSLIGGLLRPTSGKILWGDIDISLLDDSSLSEYRNKRVGFMFQFTTLIPVLTAIENVMLPLVFRTDKKTLNHDADMLMRQMRLDNKKYFYPSQLSGGEQRRIAIARALINEPELILADEPTGDLDEDTEKKVMDILKEINEQRGVTMILVTHNPKLAMEAKRQLRMINGKLFEE